MNWHHLPNAITVARGLMAAPLLATVVAGEYGWALAIAAVAGFSDVLDGYLAKRHDWRSTLGGLLDPLADKLFLCAALLGLWWVQALPGWLLALVLARDAVILAGALVWWYGIGPFKPAPSVPSKLTTLMQVLLVLGLLLQLAGLALPQDARGGLVMGTALITVVSGGDYVVRYGLRAWRLWSKRQ